ncbi:uncharacterized protein LOC133518314 [Cydia pomonella]|uniref:uncharacterized protein LOC133518314 n=1 Tax=Cydia pomonella TaxID=82600 RepID=UPI002ADD3702|nr:uncharacterized protein LOC133518314 [Cydia pomonella]
MSPLARSLLALAALLAAADALANPYCDYLTIGRNYYADGDNVIKYTLTVSGEFYTIIPDKCSRPGRRLVHQTLVVCNDPNNVPRISLVKHSDPYTAVTIECPRDVPGCLNLELHVRQDCKPVTGPGPEDDTN